VSFSAAAQVPPLKVPDASPEASVNQTIGLTSVSISYHRPAVNKRKVWGGLVPYGEVWRAGANENTTFTISTDAKVNGQPLTAGTYGLHMLPTEKDWTVIFSRESHAWGSFSYDQKEDALRVTVTPQSADFAERLSYTFDDSTNKDSEVNLRWEKLRVPFKVEVDTPSIAVASIREQLRGLPRFSWQGWNNAANWCLQNDVNLDEAMTWADRSISLAETFQNLSTKSRLLAKKGDAAGAAAMQAKAGKAAVTENDVNLYGYALLGQKKFDDAIEVFQKNVKDHPSSWNTYDSLAEGYANKGDKAKAVANYEKALGIVKDPAQQKRIQDELKKLKG
jgi:hypothetical protein